MLEYIRMCREEEAVRREDITAGQNSKGDEYVASGP